MNLFLAIIAVTALLGHATFWVAWISRFHCRMAPKWLFRIHDVAWIILVVGLPLFYLRAIVTAWKETARIELLKICWSWPACLYVAFCCAAVVVIAVGRMVRAARLEKRNPRVKYELKMIHLANKLGADRLADHKTRLCAMLPGNQIFYLAVEKKVLEVDSLLDQITIAHLSDLHITGQLSQDFYEAVVDQTLALNADIVAITGDILDKTKYLPWLVETLGRLRATHGVYFVLGNHDQRTHRQEKIRQSLTSVGMIDLGGRAITIDGKGQPLLLAGNELPWFSPAADMEEYPPGENRQELRILLSHSPDQIDWARSHQFDVMLAGHCHGGQFRLPLLGPILSPSRYGTRFASGVFYLEPTLLHVSRGIAGTRPFRFNCSPELSLLDLRPTKKR